MNKKRNGMSATLKKTKADVEVNLCMIQTGNTRQATSKKNERKQKRRIKIQ